MTRLLSTLLNEGAGEKLAGDPEITGITADSREVGPGFLFAALPGAIVDGATFISKAEKAGAVAVLGLPGTRSTLPVIEDANPRRRLALIAAKFYPRQPRFVAGITGTNGKTSTARFAAQIWTLLGRRSGSIGTLGAHGENFHRELQHTTPDPVTLHQTLDEMTEAGIDYLAMEVSSHALAQGRADGVRFAAAAFTNITQDHLDFHDDFDDYFRQKRRLFTELLNEGGVAIVNMDGAGGRRIAEAAKAHGVEVMTTGVNGAGIQVERAVPHAGGMNVLLRVAGEIYETDMSLIGAFQAENASLAAAIVIASGENPKEVIPLLEKITGVPGRMERVAEVGDAGVYVDYAHTPDAITTALGAARPHTNGRLIAIIGAGGDRDVAKRPLMGEAAMRHADMVIVTDDNPRSEDPAEIRRQILAGATEATEIGDRAEAIRVGVNILKSGDVLMIMGKGHETGQLVGTEKRAFDDAEATRNAVREKEATQ